MFQRGHKNFALGISFTIWVTVAIALTGCERAPNPDATIKRAYNWYVQTLKSGSDPLQQARTGLKPFVTERFLTSTESLRSDLESSALIDPQSFDARLAVENVQISGPTATARVVLTGRTIGRQTINIYLVKEDARWKIDDVKLIDQGSSDF